MPSKKREVQTFATRLSPLLVRKLDAYAIQSGLSRNQAIERLLNLSFSLSQEVRGLRQFVDGRTTVEEESLSGGEYFERLYNEREQNLEFERMAAAQILAKRDFESKADDEDKAEPKKRVGRKPK